MAVNRINELKRRRAKVKRVAKLREKYRRAKNEQERKAVLTTLPRKLPTMSEAQFLAPLKGSKG